MLNVGITVLPDADMATKVFAAGVVRGADSIKGFTAETVHNTFNHRNSRIPNHLPDCTADAPESWRKFEVGPCDSCLRANCDRVHSNKHAGMRADANDTYSFDIWSVSVGHVHGGNKSVLGCHANGSGLTRFMILKSGHENETSAAMRDWFNWCRAKGKVFTHAHTDNAPNLCMGATRKLIEETERCLLTTSAAYEARGNSTIERAWRSSARDMRAALVGAKLEQYPEFWWYAMRDAMTKSWCIPDKLDPTTTPWEKFTGTKPRVTQHRPFGCLAYKKVYLPPDLQGGHARRALHLLRAR